MIYFIPFTLATILLFHLGKQTKEPSFYILSAIFACGALASGIALVASLTLTK
jgi:hypothetical protein